MHISAITFILGLIEDSSAQTSIPIGEYDITKSVQIVEYGNNVDTTIVLDSIPRKAEIFVEGRSYHYNAFYISPNNDTISKTNIDFIGTNRKWRPFDENDWQVSFLMVNNYSTSDSVYFTENSKNQTYSNWKDTVNEGAVENIEEVMIHPIRFNQFIWTLSIGYPEVNKPITTERHWTNEINIPKEVFGDWGGSKIKSKYAVIGKKSFRLENKNLECWEIECTSEMDGKLAHLRYLFHPDFGFVFMNYENYDGDKISFRMNSSSNANADSN